MAGTLCMFLVCGLLVTSSLAQKWGRVEDEEKLKINFQQGIRFDEFDLQLCQSLYSASPSSNVAVSPVSVKLVLAMLYEAARGETATELQRTLNLPVSKKMARVKFGAIHKSLSAPSNTTELKIASRIFVPPNTDSSYGFQRVLEKYFSASIQIVDFSKPRDAAKIINNWVCNATEGKISSMIDPNDPDIPNLSVILSNALFFKGLWEIPFEPEATREAKFYLNNNDTIQVQMMQNTDTYYLAENKESGYTILRLPYHGEKYSLYIVLPNARDGIASVVDKLTPDGIRNTVKKMEPSVVSLFLPKFSFQFAVDLEPILIKLGIRKTFDAAGADFPLISNSSRVYVSRILHKAGLEVNELGSTVYGATTITMPDRNRPPGEETFFKVNHPFVFFIKDDTAETIVFAAKVENPRTMAPGVSPSTGSNVPQARPALNVSQSTPKPVYYLPQTTTTSSPQLGNRIQTSRPPSFIQVIPPRRTDFKKPRYKRQFPGNQFPSNQFPGNQFSGNGFPGNQFPGNQFPGNQFPGNQFPGNQFSGNGFSGPNYPPFTSYPSQGSNFYNKKKAFLKKIIGISPHGHKSHWHRRPSTSRMISTTTPSTTLSTTPETTPVTTPETTPVTTPNPVTEPAPLTSITVPSTTTDFPLEGIVEIFGTPPPDQTGPAAAQTGRRLPNSGSSVQNNEPWNSTSIQSQVDKFFFNIVSSNGRPNA